MRRPHKTRGGVHIPKTSTEGELPRFGNSRNVEMNQLLRYTRSNSQRPIVTHTSCATCLGKFRFLNLPVGKYHKTADS
jgi:hypothetical protein